jgi:hypothetical protein
MPTAPTVSIRILTLAVAVAAPVPASAAGVVDTLFPIGQGTCWGRSYDAAHLAKHPAQKVRTIHLWDHWGKNGLYETPDDPDYADPDGRDTRVFPTILVERADRPGVAGRSLPCKEVDGRLGCVADEDDGVHFPLRLTPKDGAVIADLSEPGLDLTRPPDLAQLGRPPQEIRLAPGADDRQFRLERRPIAECRERLVASAPDYARDDRPPLRAIVQAALDRSTVGPDRTFRPEGGRVCLKATGGATPIVAGFNPALGDFMTGVDAFTLRAVRGAPGSAKRYLFHCKAKAWEWRCEASLAGPDGSRDGEPVSAHLLRRGGGVALIVSSALWSGSTDEKRLDPPIVLEAIETKACPSEIWAD